MERIDKGLKYFISYKDDSIDRPLCIIFSQMSGYIKYFDNGGKNIPLMVEDDGILIKYSEIWIKVKKKLNIEFHSMSLYDGKYIKAKVKKFNAVVNTNFWGNKVPKEVVHYTCIVRISIDSVMKMEKKNYPQLYLEKCKYRIKNKTDIQIYRQWIRARFWFWFWIVY